MSVLVLAEHDGKHLRSSTYSTVSAALQLDSSVSVLVAGSTIAHLADEAAAIDGVSQVIGADHAVYEHGLAERLALLIQHMAENFSHLLAPATTFGKNVMPRVAALLNLSQISDVIKIIDPSTYCRPIYAGGAIAKIKSLDKKQVITVRPSAFSQASAGSNKAEVIFSDYVAEDSSSQFVSQERHLSGRPDLSSAEFVIAGGRGLQNKTNFDRLVAIADQMKAAIGATRAAVDAGFAPNDWQVGQTGQIVAPKLYIAVGISGAIQHVAGMKDSQVIAAINKDAEAPIFQMADYALVADINEVLTQWEALLQKEKEAEGKTAIFGEEGG